MFDVVPITSPFTVREVPLVADLPPEVLARIDTLWQAERLRRPGLEDGVHLSLDGREGSTITAHFVPYRWWIAQLREPALAPVLRIRPLAVSGLLRMGGGVVLGQRSREATQDPGAWELTPSGGIDEGARRSGQLISTEDQLVAELREELGVPADAVRALTPLAFVEDRQTAVCDMAFEMRLGIDDAELLRRFAGRDSDEYTELRVVPKDELQAFMSGVRVAPISVEILHVAGLA